MKQRTGLILGLTLAAFVSNAPTFAATATKEAADDRIVCKLQAKTGTRFKSKICRTHLQWEEMRAQNQRDAKEMIDRPVIETRRD